MPTEQEFINYKDFVESLDEATPSANDKAVLNVGAEGPKSSVFSAIAAFVHSTFAAFVNALTAKTSFASGDKIPVVNGSTATAMEATKLLELTAQNTLADNEAPEFDPTRDADHPYLVGKSVSYNGKIYTFKNEHYGAWNVLDVVQRNIKGTERAALEPVFPVDHYYDRDTGEVVSFPHVVTGDSVASVFRLACGASSSVRIKGTTNAALGVYIVGKNPTPNTAQKLLDIPVGDFDVKIFPSLLASDLTGVIDEKKEFSIQINVSVTESWSVTITDLSVSFDLKNCLQITDVRNEFINVDYWYNRYSEKEVVPKHIEASSSVIGVFSTKITKVSCIRLNMDANVGGDCAVAGTSAGVVTKLLNLPRFSAGSNFEYTFRAKDYLVQLESFFADCDEVHFVMAASSEDDIAIDVNSVQVSSELVSRYEIEELGFGVKKNIQLVNSSSGEYTLGNNTIAASWTMSGGWNLANSKGVVTVKNSEADEDVVLEKIHIRVSDAGKYRFFTAMIDQNNLLTKAANYFDLNLSSGINDVDVSSLYVVIPKDHHLFAYLDYYKAAGASDGGVRWKDYQSDTSHLDVEMLYNTPSNQVVRRLATTGGGAVDFYWEAIGFNSAFASKSEAKSLENKIEVVNEQILTSKIITGANGKSYVLGVDLNGNVVALVQEFSNGLCFGNSLTDHAPSPERGWYGDDWPMAASNKTTGWVNELQEIFKEKDPDAVVGKIGGTTISAFERNPGNYVTDSDFDAVMGNYLNENLDFIIWKAGENVLNASDYKAGLLRFFNYLQRKYPNAQIFVAQPFYAGTAITNAQQQAAIESHLTYIPDSESVYHKQQLGMFTYGADNNEYPIIDGPVADHLGDVGFLIWANTLATLFGYTPLDWRKSVTISSASGIDYQVCENTGVKGGLYTVLGKGTQPSVSVEDGNGNAVSYTIHDMTGVSWRTTPTYVPDWAITFVIPSTDVTVSLS